MRTPLGTAPIAAVLRHVRRSPLTPKILLATAILGACAAAWAFFLPIPDTDTINNTVNNLRGWAPVLALICYVLAVQVCAPTTALNAALGVAFGMVYGTLLAWLGGVLSALLGFFVARYLAARRTMTAATTPDRPLALRAVSRLLDDHPTAAVAGVRAIGIAPFAPTNYALGLTNVSVVRFTIGTAIGIAPGVIANTAMGAYSTSPTSWQLWAGILFTGVLLVVGGKAAARAAAREKAAGPTQPPPVPPDSATAPANPGPAQPPPGARRR